MHDLSDVSYILNHLGEESSRYFHAVAPPLMQTSNFSFETVDDLRLAFTNEQNTHLYTRGNNPTVEILRKKVAALAGAEDALIFSSGVAAVTAAVMAQVQQGDHIVCVQKPYSWTRKLLAEYLPRFGVTATFVDGTDIEHFAEAIQPTTRVFFLESPNTFTFELQDLKAVSALAKQHNIVTIIDNSYCTSLGQRCIDMGIDIEVHSATKYYGGHSDVVAGLLIGNKERISHIFKTEFLNTGAIISPHDAWLLLRSLRTLPLRLERIRQTTEAVVSFLENHPQVEKMYYPFSASFAQHELATQQMLWCGGLFTICLKADNAEAVEKFCNSLRAFKMAVSWGGHESLMMPTVAFYPKGAYKSDVFPFNMIRFYIGLEDEKFLLQDLKQALQKIE